MSAAPLPGAPARGLLDRGDVILAINGQPVSKSNAPSVMEASASLNQVIAQIRANPEGSSLKLEVNKRSSGPETINITPKHKDGNGPQTIGVLLAGNLESSEMVKTKNVGDAAKVAYDYTSTLTQQTAAGFAKIFGSMFSSENTGSMQVSGPVGLIKTGSDVVATKDITAIVMFAAAISVNLAVVNALPLPALDGGQLVFVLAEALSGRKVDQRIQEEITGIALFVLLAFSLSTVVGDVSDLFR